MARVKVRALTLESEVWLFPLRYRAPSHPLSWAYTKRRERPHVIGSALTIKSPRQKMWIITCECTFHHVAACWLNRALIAYDSKELYTGFFTYRHHIFGCSCKRSLTYMCVMAQSYVQYDSCIFVSWRTHTIQMPRETCKCVCIYMRIYTFMCTCTYIYTCIDMYLHICVYICLYKCI